MTASSKAGEVDKRKTAMSVEALIEAIHASPLRLSLCICGAGGGAISRLTSIAGCSRTLLLGQVLYNRHTAEQALDCHVNQFVSATTARQLAQHAFQLSQQTVCAEARAAAVPLDLSEENLIGVGATSAVQTGRARRGMDQAFVSIWGTARRSSTPAPTDSVAAGGAASAKLADAMWPAHRVEGLVSDYHLELPNTMSREEQDEQVALLILHAIADRLSSRDGGESAQQALVSETPQRSISGRFSALPSEETVQALQWVTTGAVKMVQWNRWSELRCSEAPYTMEAAPERTGGSRCSDAQATPARRRLVYPGSFNPLHWGHTELSRAACRVVAALPLPAGAATDHDEKAPVGAEAEVHLTYEIAIKAVGKSSVDISDLQRRVKQFQSRGERVAVTSATLFIEKAALFPGSGFVIGVDTARRIVDPVYYSTAEMSPSEAEAQMIIVLKREVGDRGCYFVVGGRCVAKDGGSGGAWESISSLVIPEAIRHLFIDVPESVFRVDVSSTELRALRGGRGA